MFVIHYLALLNFLFKSNFFLESYLLCMFNIVVLCAMKLKQELIGFRADEDTKKIVTQLAANSKRIISDYLRLLIEYAQKNKLKL